MSHSRHRGNERNAWALDSLSTSCPHLARRLSCPALERIRECAAPREAEQPRDLRYMQLAVVEVTDCKIATQVLKYFTEVQTFVRKPSRKRFLAHSPAATSSTNRAVATTSSTRSRTEILGKLTQHFRPAVCPTRVSLKMFPSTYQASHSPARKASNAGDFRACLSGNGRIAKVMVSAEFGNPL